VTPVSESSLAIGPGLGARRVRVADADVVWLRSILEGYDGLAALYGDGSGVVVLTAPDSRLAELDELLDELCKEAQLQRL
jgi:hypothetical protein